MSTLEDFAGALTPSWCPGCGNFGILNAVKNALVELNIAPHEVLFVSDIGQNGKLPHYTRGNVFNSLHGRAVPPAVAAKIINRNLNVIIDIGDGGAYGEGLNHLIHAMRRNHDVTCLVHDNQVYGLTLGQASPTTDIGGITKTTPQGAPPPVNPLLLALAVDCGFVARGFADDVAHLAKIIKAGVAHRGFALIDILQPCVSFNHKNTHQWYRERVYKLEGTGYLPDDKTAAWQKAQEWGAKIPTGVIYRHERPVYEEALPVLDPDEDLEHIVVSGKIDKLITEFV
ncbi:MAG: 2-oxoacid:ferredoxin oxidoreductase subunit beta [Dehalococcoidales bacterium]|nr:2-oxoacid:ferredoxin oxidoreductase subunit beta [Dehalococcoidales bacterium]